MTELTSKRCQLFDNCAYQNGHKGRCRPPNYPKGKALAGPASLPLASLPATPKMVHVCPKCLKPIWGEGSSVDHKTRYFSHCPPYDGTCDNEIAIPVDEDFIFAALPLPAPAAIEEMLIFGHKEGCDCLAYSDEFGTCTTECASCTCKPKPPTPTANEDVLRRALLQTVKALEELYPKEWSDLTNEEEFRAVHAVLHDAHLALQQSAPPTIRKHGDKHCPCPDGDPCHYEGDNPMSAPAGQSDQEERSLRAKNLGIIRDNLRWSTKNAASPAPPEGK